MNRTDGTRMAATHLQLMREVEAMTHASRRRWIRYVQAFRTYILPGLALVVLGYALVIGGAK